VGSGDDEFELHMSDRRQIRASLLSIFDNGFKNKIAFAIGV